LNVTFRTYESNDRGGCEAVFDGNVPHFFAESERTGFSEFLDEATDPYWVVEHDGRIIGCGGYGIWDQGFTASLCWGMIASDLHGKRLGEYLLTARLIEILNEPAIQSFRVATSQHTESFFEKYGFIAERRIENGFADGLDKIEMRLSITPESKQNLRLKWNSVQGMVKKIGAE